MVTARSCFQQNSVTVLVSKLVSKILHVPPGEYIGSSLNGGKKVAIL